MADLADVELALLDAIVGALYPAGTDAASAIGAPARISRGRPTNSSLINDRSTGSLNISIFALTESKNTTRWGVQVSELPANPSLAVTASGNSATFAGVAAMGDLAGIFFSQRAFVYQAQTYDTAALVAAALADAVRTVTICWLTGATLTVPGVPRIVGRTASSASTLEEWSRQEQAFQVSIYAIAPMLRDMAAQIICQTLAQIGFLTLADGTGGRLRYRSMSNIDADQAASVYRRDIVYDIEFGTTILKLRPTMLFGDLVLNGTTIFA